MNPYTGKCNDKQQRRLSKKYIAGRANSAAHYSILPSTRTAPENDVSQIYAVTSVVPTKHPATRQLANNIMPIGQ